MEGGEGPTIVLYWFLRAPLPASTVNGRAEEVTGRWKGYDGKAYMWRPGKCRRGVAESSIGLRQLSKTGFGSWIGLNLCFCFSTRDAGLTSSFQTRLQNVNLNAVIGGLPHSPCIMFCISKRTSLANAPSATHTQKEHLINKKWNKTDSTQH
jgi:hypothetical protein